MTILENRKQTEQIKESLDTQLFEYLLRYFHNIGDDNGGIAIVAMEDVDLQTYLNKGHSPEYVELIGKDYLGALYLTNNEYSILVIYKVCSAPKDILAELI